MVAHMPPTEGAHMPTEGAHMPPTEGAQSHRCTSKVAKANISENYCSGCFPQSFAITAANVAILRREN